MAQDEEGEAPHDEQEEETSALLPKSILAGKEFKVGEEVVLKIDAIHDDEIEVSYATGKSKEPAGDESAMDTAKGGLDSYAKTPGQM
jgi:hypothetical protein